MKAIVDIQNLKKDYPGRQALRGISLRVDEGVFFCLLGPNGSGKSTLFRILATLTRATSGSAFICGWDVALQSAAVRSQIGVVFQSPAVDLKLRVVENLRYGGALYGLHGVELARRINTAAKALHIENRLHDPVEKLSGGLRRRVEIAKCLISRPKILLLDEPSTGLDPRSRADMWSALSHLRKETGVTVLFTSHHLDDADHAEQIAILNSGLLVTEGKASDLRSAIPGQVITLRAKDALTLATQMKHDFQVDVQASEGVIHLHAHNAFELAAAIADRYPSHIISTTIGSATLEDVFFEHTGARFSTMEEVIHE